VGLPALSRFFTAAFGLLGRPATPVCPQTVRLPRPETVFADRLGMIVRAGRVHVVQLAAPSGSEGWV
jgi:hypothetical protein